MFLYDVIRRENRSDINIKRGMKAVNISEVITPTAGDSAEEAE
jgi:hypothetical protein